MRHIVAVAFALVGLGACVLPALGQATAPASQPADEIVLNFPDNAPLKLLVDYVSQRLGVNFLYDEQVAAQRITIRSPAKVTKASLPALLESVLRMKNLAVVEAGLPGWKRIVAAANLNSVAQPTTRIAGGDLPVVAQIFALKHTDTAKVDPILKPFLTQPGGNSIAIPEQRTLIVTDFASNIGRISQLVALVDQPRAAVSVEFATVRHVEASQLAQQVSQTLAAKGRFSGLAPLAGEGLEISHDPRTNQLILIGPRQRIEEALAILRSLDVPLEVLTRTYAFSSVAPERVDRLTRELIGAATAKRLYQSVIDADARMLIVTAPPEVHQRIQELKAELDVPLPEEQSPIRFFKLTNATASEVMETIRSIAGQGDLGAVSLEGARGGETAPRTPAAPPAAAGASGAPPGVRNVSNPSETPAAEPAVPRPAAQTLKTARATITADVNTNTIIVIADPAAQRVYEQLIRMLDRRRPQVLLECTIVTLDTSNNFSFAVDISAGNLETNSENKYVTLSSFGVSRVDRDTGRLSLMPGTGFTGALLSGDIADIVVRALSSNSRAMVVSAPKILVNDNATGTLVSVSESPFTSVNASQTVATTSFAGYATAGTTITLTPHIAQGDHLQLEYAISLNSFVGAGSAGIPPPRKTDSVASKVTIPDGHCIVVGGINRRSSAESRTTIPLLGEIPLLRDAFGSSSRERSDTTLFVFIRPIVLRDDQFEDLKYLSGRDFQAAGLPAEYPTSEPMPMP